MRNPVAVALPILLLAGCTPLFFQPHRIQVLTPDQLGLAYQEVHFPTADGLELHGWFLPAKGCAAGTVLHLHGNAENISTHVAGVAWLPARGFNVFLIDYRGYGASEGQPTLDGAQKDIDAAMKTLLERTDVEKDRIVFYGQSLGGALAVYNVAHSPFRDHIRALVIESTFSDYVEIAREKLAGHWFTWPLQWLPSLTVDNRYSPLLAVKMISPIPLLIIQGDQDAIVPVHDARQLYDAALEPKQLWIVPGARHIQAMRQEAQRDRLVAYLREVLAASTKAR
ncbi:MAG: alpha/beta hydrolase [Burkholderiales bacterium]